MGISCSPGTITVTDDSNPSRPPLVLQLPQDPAAIKAAIDGYLALPPAPNFDGFGLWLLTDPIVQAAYDAAFDGDKLAAGTLPAAVLAAAGGEPKHLRVVLLRLRRQGHLPNQILAGMIQKAAEYNLPAEFIEALGG